jgi:hypothetical protein
VRRATAIAQAEASAQPEPEGEHENMAARGVPDLDDDKKSGEKERKEASNNDKDVNRTDKTRGEGKSLKKGEK